MHHPPLPSCRHYTLPGSRPVGIFRSLSITPLFVSWQDSNCSWEPFRSFFGTSRASFLLYVLLRYSEGEWALGDVIPSWLMKGCGRRADCMRWSCFTDRVKAFKESC